MTTLKKLMTYQQGLIEPTGHDSSTQWQFRTYSSEADDFQT